MACYFSKTQKCWLPSFLPLFVELSSDLGSALELLSIFGVNSRNSSRSKLSLHKGQKFNLGTVEVIDL